MKNTPDELHRQYVSISWPMDKEEVLKMTALWSQVKKFYKAKKFPIEWDDKMLIDFFTITIRYWWHGIPPAEFKYLQEKYWTHFLSAYEKVIELGSTQGNCFFIMGIRQKLDKPFKKYSLPKHDEYILRVSFVLDCYRYQQIYTLFMKSEYFLQYSKNKCFVNHLIYCIENYNYGVNDTFGHPDYDMHIYYASIVVLILSEDEQAYISIKNLLHPETPRQKKQSEVHSYYEGISNISPKNSSSKKLIQYLEDTYPKDWLTNRQEEQVFKNSDVYYFDPKTWSKAYILK